MKKLTLSTNKTWKTRTKPLLYKQNTKTGTQNKINKLRKTGTQNLETIHEKLTRKINIIYNENMENWYPKLTLTTNKTWKLIHITNINLQTEHGKIQKITLSTNKTWKTGKQN